MATSTKLEELQCLAFAYFAANPHSPDPEHQQNWVDEFSTYIAKQDFELKFEKGPSKIIRSGERITESVVNDINNSTEKFFRKNIKKDPSLAVKRLQYLYGQYLGKRFNFSRLVEDNGYPINITQNEKSGRLTYVVPPKIRRSYVTAEAFVRSPIIPTKNLSSYVFLDQNDIFTSTIKDKSLLKIGKVLSLQGSSELLSPVDMFFVRRGEEASIIQEFKKHIIDAPDEQILSNMSFGTTGKNTYRTITNRCFADRSMIGVSLKSAPTINAPTNIKIVGTVLGNTSGEKDLFDFVDPYGKLIGQMMTKDADVGKLIDKAITIKFNDFVINSNRVSWEYPVTFNYDEMIDSKTNQPLYHSKLHFELLTWTDAGFNGWWKIGGKQKSPWASGMAVGSAEKMFYRYHEYKNIIKDIIDIRINVFKELVPLSSVPVKEKALYNAAVRELGMEKILRAVSNTPNTEAFFKEHKTGPGVQDYYLEVVRQLTKDMKSNIRVVEKTFVKGSKKEGTRRVLPVLNAHFVASQLAFFLFRGGKSYELLLKKRIFLSIFGVLTKSGYKIFEGNAGKVEMTNYIRKIFKENGRKVEAYYSAAPYVLLT